MNNQAAQTMPEPVTASMCPSSDYAKGWNDCLAALSQTAGVAQSITRLVESGHARWCSAKEGAGCSCDYVPEKKGFTHSAAAAPAASGGESAASVSERARSSMKLPRFGRGNGATPWILEPHIDGYWTPWHTAQSELDMAVESSTQLERALEQALTQQRGEPAAWLIRDERGRVVDAVESEAQRDRLLNTGYGQLPQWTAEPLYAGSAPLASAGTSWTHEDLKDLRERLVSAGISAHLNGDSNKASDRQFIRQAVTEAYGLIDDLLTTTPQPSADAVRELVKRWRTGASLCTRQDYGDGARDALNECADELESLLSAASGEKGVGGA